MYFRLDGKRVDVFGSSDKKDPVIYLNTFGHEGEAIYEIVKEHGAKCSLIAISDLEWNHDMSPGEAPSLWKGDEPSTPGADDYLALLVNRIAPIAEEEAGLEPIWRGIAGYSLAGLFAIYSMYRTAFFTRYASASGSFWFPDFSEEAIKKDPISQPERIYLSLGDREAHVKNKLVATVEEKTRELYDHYMEMGYDTIFVLNQGNHFVDASIRMAKGIEWILS